MGSGSAGKRLLYCGPSASRLAIRPRILIPLLLAGGCTAVAVAGVLSFDWLARRLYGHVQPTLERQLSAVLGHPLQLGSYQGLGWSGLRLGPTRLLPAPSDPSSVGVTAIEVSVDPLSSLRRRLPVVHLSLSGVTADLRPNDEGGYWRLGQADADQPPPRLDVRWRLLQPAALRIEPAGLNLQALSTGSVQPHRQLLSGQLQLGVAGEASLPLRLRGGGNWRSGRWQADLTSRNFELNPLVRGLARRRPLPGQLRGRLDGRLRLALDGNGPECRGELRGRQLSWVVPDRPALELPLLPVQCQGTQLRLPSSDWRWGNRSGLIALQTTWRQGQLDLQSVELRSGQSWLRGRGRVGAKLALTAEWQLQPSDLPLPPGTSTGLLGSAIQGDLKLAGNWQRPQLSSSLSQASNPLLDGWRAQLRWQDQQLVLDQLSSPYLRGRGQLPLALGGSAGVRVGALAVEAQLQQFPLDRLSALLGTRLDGTLTAAGTIRGPLSGLTPDFRLLLEQVEVGPLQLAEDWQGDWFGEAAGGGRLALQPRGGQGLLEARLDQRWVPVAIDLRREQGTLSLRGTPRSYRWQAKDFPLAGLQLALGPTGRFQPLEGGLRGEGSLGLQPLGFKGVVELQQASVLGVAARRVRLEGEYRNRRYQARGVVVPQSGGELALDWNGRWLAGFQARLRGRALEDGLVRQLLAAWPQWNGAEARDPGRAADLGTLLIDTLGGSLDEQLAALNRAQARVLRQRRDQLPGLSTAERLEQLAARFDLDAELKGPRLADTQLDLNLSGHVWLPGQDRDVALSAQPMELSLQGPVRLGSGSLEVQGVPLALLALLTPVPDQLRGTLGIRGRYRLGSQTELALDLDVENAGFGQTDLSLQRGTISLENGALLLDLALRAAGADSGIDLAGRVPLDPTAEGVELRLSSRDDGLIFLSRLAQPALDWKEGTADLQLLVRGSLRRPIANGFLRLQNGELTVVEQGVADLQATMLFDFEKLILQEFSAAVGAQGKLSGEGSIGLVTPQLTAEGEPAALRLSLAGLAFRFPRINAVTNGELLVGGSLAGLRVSGELGISKGSINVQPARLASEEEVKPATASVVELAEQRWDFKAPLVLYGPDVESETSEQLRALVPNLPMVRFDNLRLSLGPDLGVGVPGLASFQTVGNLRIDGPFDPTIQAQGVVRLKQGRLGLFTTTFNLDPDSPNVAVFTPSLGLVPFLDITLRTRVSDSLSTAGVFSDPAGGLSPFTTSATQLETQGFSSLNQLNLVQVYLSVSGPADRLAESISLRSSPPLPQDRLMALIGGNTLAGVVGGGAGTALATVLGQSLLSPILGTLGDAFGQRLSLAIYPAYVNQGVNRPSEQRSGRVPPQLVLATEAGVDLTNRFSVSLLAAPNVDNVPPQVNLTFKASELFNVQGSVDTDGTWQTQLQVFFRF
jgi:translocation and assembly module TamB